ncbi:MAG: hypothetical protein JOS17DRAFT_755000 [Linnemannia elongata]|nr:MAG: hypothetical protein JOS17DRAFT_755000 [Linnemannia elongata]
MRQFDPVSQYRPSGDYRNPLTQHRPSIATTPSISHPHPYSSTVLNIRSQEIRTALTHMSFHHASGPSTPLLQDQPSKKEHKEVQKLKRQAYRKFRKSQAPSPAAYKLDGGALEDNVILEAVKQHSKHHAPYPDYLDAPQHDHHHHQKHDHAADHAQADQASQAATKNDHKSRYTHISDYQKQLHHHHYDPTTQNQLQPQAQPQQQHTPKKSNINDEPKGYLSLSFKQPLTPDYYADEVCDKSAVSQIPELGQFAHHHKPARQSHRERAGPAQ